MLLTRRNEALESILRQELDRLKAAEGRGGSSNSQPRQGRNEADLLGVAKGRARPRLASWGEYVRHRESQALQWLEALEALQAFHLA